MRPQRKIFLSLLAASGVGLLAALLAGRGAEAQPPSENRWTELAKLDDKTRALVVNWLEKDCEAAEKRRLIDQLVAVGVRLEPVFREAYRLGPPPERIEQDRAVAKIAFEQRQAWLRENGEQMMGDEARTLLATTPDAYADRQLANVAIGWRERALMGLGLVGDDKALADLQRIAADPKAPLAAAAKRGIEERLKLRKP
ncbi:MAG TPA: hypothetical protein VF121_15500 [Thermoanaerobaculia bacterium]|nr:hypothetical protein [Thermoanaerobaculia bacterium]